MSALRQRIKSKRWLLLVAVLKRIVKFKNQVKFQKIGVVQENKHTKKKNSLNETHVNSGAKVECFVWKEIKW